MIEHGDTYLSSQIYGEAQTQGLIQAGQGMKWDPTSKIINAKWAGCEHGSSGTAPA
jgi:hypothetical protein